MTDAKHSPHGDTSFWWSLAQHLGGAVALVLVVAAAFWGVGQVRGDEDTPNPVISSPEPSDDPVAAPSTSEPTADPTVDDPDPTPTSAPTSEPTSDPTVAPTADPEPTASPTATEPAATGVSVQLLDATPDVEGDMQDLADRMRADGYRVVATNRAVRMYEQTTVFYTEGYEAAAREVAERYGFDVVEPKPSNLNDTVQVHIVVGQDYQPAEAD